MIGESTSTRGVPAVVHGVNPACPEYSLCGMAYDAYEVDAEAGQVILAKPGEKITCIGCKYVINECRKFKRYKQP